MSVDARPRLDRRTTRPAPPPPGAYLAALRRAWLVVVLAVTVAASSAYAVSELLLPSVYRSSSTLLIKNQPVGITPSTGLPAEPFVDDQSLSETFEQLALQPAVVAQVAERLGVRPSQVQESVQVHALPRTPLVVISFDQSTPRAAARGAQAYTADFVQRTQRNELLPGRALVVSAATVPTEPVAPRPVLNALIAGVAGFFLALLVVFGRAHTRASPVASAAAPPPPAAASRASARRGSDAGREYLAPHVSETVNGQRGGI